MVDFAKLLDPEFQAKMKAERDQRAARQEAQHEKIRAALSVFEGIETFDRLPEREQKFVISVQRAASYLGLSPKQEQWLFDLAGRESSQFAAEYPRETAVAPPASPVALGPAVTRVPGSGPVRRRFL